MVFWGKKKIKEIDAAGQFVMSITRGVQQHWSSIAKELNELPLKDKPISEDEYAAFEFCLAVIVCQIQALPNLLNEKQASRIREYILQCISNPDLGSYPKDAITEYQTAWDDSLKQGELPIYGIASVLFDKLECKNMLEIGDNKFKSPVFLMVLGEKVVTFGGPWWKNIISKYKIVP